LCSTAPRVNERLLARSYGYDPLGLGKDDETLAKFRANELIHARWAMLAAAGIIIPEGLQANGAAIKGGVWFETGAEMLNGGTLNYFAVPWGIVSNPLPLFAVIAVEVGLLGAVEKYRSEGEGPAGYSPGTGKFDSDIFDGLDSLYPGGPFDPLGLSDDPEVFEELKVKEIKNGRLAMISVLVRPLQLLGVAHAISFRCTFTLHCSCLPPSGLVAVAINVALHCTRSAVQKPAMQLPPERSPAVRGAMLIRVLVLAGFRGAVVRHRGGPLRQLVKACCRSFWLQPCHSAGR
jgi:hypothetical protein